jgi:hypothetical protein
MGEAESEHSIWALGLLLELHEKSEAPAEVESITKNLAREFYKDPRLEAATLISLLRYFYAVREYDKAEDCLFFLAEQGSAEAPGMGDWFFSRLERLPDESLAQGGMDWADIEESRDKFKAICAE